MLLNSILAQKAASIAAGIAIGTSGGLAATAIITDPPDVEPQVVETTIEEPAEDELVAEVVAVDDSEVDDSEADDSEADDSEAGLPEPAEDDPDTAELPYGDDCDAGNHGDYVSSVARDPDVDEAEGNKGSIVSQAARSDCGKDTDSDDTDETEVERDTDTDAEDDEDDDKPGNSGRRDDKGNNGNGPKDK